MNRLGAAVGPQRAPRRAPRPAVAVLLWWRAARLAHSLRRTPLPAIVAGLMPNRMPAGPSSLLAGPPRYVSHVVDRSLRAGSWQPRCLVRALVLFELLREAGEQPWLVIGLPEQATDQRAHAWVELDGNVVGPSPGAWGHVEIARYA